MARSANNSSKDRRRISGNAVLERLVTALKIPDKRGREKKLADHLRISSSLLAHWRSSDYVGLEHVVDLCVRCNLDLNQIVLGHPWQPHEREASELRASEVESSASTPMQPNVDALEFLDVPTPTDPVIHLTQIQEYITTVLALLHETKAPDIKQ